MYHFIDLKKSSTLNINYFRNFQLFTIMEFVSVATKGNYLQIFKTSFCFILFSLFYAVIDI